MAILTGTDLATLDYEYYGEPGLFYPAKSAVDTALLDHEYFGEPLATNPAPVSATTLTATANVITVSAPVVTTGLTLSVTANVITISAPVVDVTYGLSVLTNTITITAPAARVVGNRKYPLPRLELADWLFSQGSERHALPAFVAFQDVADIP